jgi:outer membrane protein OmpA-like peptidoglycan-associated protein
MSAAIHHRSGRAANLVLAGVLGFVALTGAACSSSEDEPCAAGLPPASGPLLLGVAVHANAPAPSLSAPVVDLVQAALLAGDPVRVIGIDGTPHVTTVPTPTIKTGTCAAQRTTVIRATNAVTAAVRAESADSDGDNVYGALGLASDLLAAEGWQRAHLVLLDSGLSDVAGAPVDMTQPGMIGAEASDVARFARAHAPLDLAGLDVTLVSFGYTAPPQAPLNAGDRAAVTAIWVEVLTRQGAHVAVLPVPRPAVGPTTTRTTGITALDPNEPFVPPGDGGRTSIVYSDARPGPVRFEPDSVEFVDPDAARHELQPVIGWLAADPLRRVVVTGTTSSAGTAPGRARVSKARAERIAALLAEGPGVRRSQIATRGVGYQFPARVDDRTGSGDLDPARAARNRSVRITVIAPA